MAKDARDRSGWSSTPVLTGNSLSSSGDWMLREYVLKTKAVKAEKAKPPLETANVLEWEGSQRLPEISRFSNRSFLFGNHDYPVPLDGASQGFDASFVTGDGAVQSFSGGSLHKYRPRRGILVENALAELGGRDQAAASTVQMWAVLGLRSDGKFISSPAPYFFVKDLKGALCLVQPVWYQEGWFFLRWPVSVSLPPVKNGLANAQKRPSLQERNSPFIIEEGSRIWTPKPPPSRYRPGSPFLASPASYQARGSIVYKRFLYVKLVYFLYE